MSIALDFRDNIQFVALDGPFTKPEESALRLKLDQKFSQGRTLIVFKLDRFQLDHSDSMNALKELLSYFISLGAWIGISGINEKQSGGFYQLLGKKCKAFATESDAQKWIIAESQKPKEAKPEKANDDEIKRVEINLLIQSYASGFVEKDADPFRISKLAQEYAARPSVDFLHAVRSLTIEKDKVEIEIQKKEAELAQTENILLEFMKIRKLPATESEIQSHMKLAETKSTETDKNLLEIQTEITKSEAKITDLKSQSEEFQNKWQKKFETLAQDLKDLKQKNEKAEVEMKKRETEETELIQKLRQGAS